ncbi:hypothetical protein J6590_099993, partial [Homalodisca vitripennis]
MDSSCNQHPEAKYLTSTIRYPWKILSLRLRQWHQPMEGHQLRQQSCASYFKTA